MCAGLAGIAAKSAVPAIVAAKIGQRQKYFARVSNNAGFETLFGRAGCSEKVGKNAVVAANQLQGGLARDGEAGLHVG